MEFIVKQMRDDNWEPDLIVGLTRGGLIPAVILSHMLDKQMQSLNWSTRDHVEKCSDAALAADAVDGLKILIVDDICDSGLTFRELKDDWASAVSDPINWHDTTRFATIDYKVESKFKLIKLIQNQLIT